MLAQLAFSDTTGIGFSGIGYALFGFLLVKSKTSEVYKNVPDSKTMNLFLFWLVLYIVLTKTEIWTVGNAAHIGGLLWGVLLAYLSRFDKYIQCSAGFSYMAILIILIYRGPFSTSYLTYQAYNLHDQEKVDEAIEAYQKILKRDPDNEFAKENVKQLEIHHQEEKAFENRGGSNR